MAEASDMINIIRLQAGTGQLHEKVVLLIGSLGRGEDAHSIRSEIIADPFKRIGGKSESLLPRDFGKPLTIPDKRKFESIGMANELPSQPALDA
jgi:hypothetical protein